MKLKPINLLLIPSAVLIAKGAFDLGYALYASNYWIVTGVEVLPDDRMITAYFLGAICCLVGTLLAGIGLEKM